MAPEAVVDVVARTGALAGAPAVLVDVGASGAPPAAWRALARAAVFVGFDPDSRAVSTSDPYGFARFVLVPKAVSDRPAETVTFNLTSSPYCSSLLRPNWPTLDEYSFSELFEVVSTVDAPAVTLDRALDELSLRQLDWLKLDSQGKDLDFYRGLGDARREGLLALDIEPGFVDFYEGENTFAEAHQALIADGFWLSRLEPQAYPRVSRATRRALADAGRQDALDALDRLGRSPTAAEARYLRTTAHLERRGAGPRDWALLWLFAMTDDRLGFALDVATRASARPDTAALGRTLLEETLRRLPRVSRRERLRTLLRDALPAPVRRGLRAALRPLPGA